MRAPESFTTLASDRGGTEVGSWPSGRRGPVHGLLVLSRPGQWLKSLVVALPAILDSSLWRVDRLRWLALATVMFTLASIVVYAVNDIADRERDRAHPVKRWRPIASGQLSVPTAVAYAATLGTVLIAVAATSAVTWWPMLAYVVLNTAYSHLLKHVPLLDVFIVAAGFILRLLQGYLSAGGDVSEWLLCCVFALCLLLVLGKRRRELATSGPGHRPALRGYSMRLAEHLILLTATLTIVAYLLYLRDDVRLGAPDTTAVLGSAPFALFGVFRYLQMLFVEEGGADPVRALVRDRVMIANVLLWAAVLVIAVLFSVH